MPQYVYRAHFCTVQCMYDDCTAAFWNQLVSKVRAGVIPGVMLVSVLTHTTSSEKERLESKFQSHLMFKGCVSIFLVHVCIDWIHWKNTICSLSSSNVKLCFELSYIALRYMTEESYCCMTSHCSKSFGSQWVVLDFVRAWDCPTLCWIVVNVDDYGLNFPCVALRHARSYHTNIPWIHLRCIHSIKRYTVCKAILYYSTMHQIHFELSQSRPRSISIAMEWYSIA